MSESSGLSPLKRAFLALEEMKAKLDALEQAAAPSIAVIGIGCRFPGDADSPEAFWRLLLAGRDAISETPADRWDVEALYDPDPNAPGKMYTRWGGFLSSVDRFDPQFFGISPREAVSMDPQQRLLLEVSWEALEHAGQSADRLVNSPTGVFVGICTTDYATLQMKYGRDEIDAYQASGSAHSIASGRLSYVLGLQGPSVSIDTACSSSLVAVHLACQSLRTKECRMALAGGVHLTLSPENTISFCKSRMLAADGHCKTFDASADGFAEGEGCGVVVLKRLADAIADGDRVLAVIRGSAVNQDGPSSGLTAPNGPSQEAVIRAALAMGKVSPEQVGYVEAHGTGTSLGDPIELQALASVLRGRQSAAHPLLIGSVKTNFGHLEAASGVAGLIKVVLALQHDTIPPHLNFRVPNPHVPWSDLPLSVVTNATPWPAGADVRIAGVSAFGFSGTNAHIVLEQAPAQEAEHATNRPAHAVTLSGKSEEALRSVARRFSDRLASDASLALSDVAFSANAGRAHLSDRVALVVSSTEELRNSLDAVAAGETPANASRGRVVGSDRPKIAFLFTGQGSQYSGMARELFDVSKVFRQAVTRCDELFRPHLPESLVSVIYSSDQRALVDQTAYTQAALFSIEYGLAELWRSWGVVPTAVLGHSLGEYVAAVVAGALTLEDAVTLVASRGKLMQAQPPGGAMAAVFAGVDRVRAELERHGSLVSIAAVNGPENTVISGERAAVESASAALLRDGVRVEPLTVSHAFHSSLMDPLLEEFERIAATLPAAPPRIALISNLTGEVANREFGSPAYWRRHLRESVQFAKGIDTLIARGIGVFVEIGPTPTLAGMAQRFVTDPALQWLPSIRRGRSDWTQMLQSLGVLHAHGAPIDWDAVHRDESPRKVTLPTYPFQRERYWIDTTGEGVRASVRKTEIDSSAHPLLGRRIRSAVRDVQFEATIDLQSVSFLGDHRKRGAAVFPATAYLEMARAAAARIFKRDDVTIEDVVMFEPLLIDDDGTRTVQLVATPDGDDAAEFRIFSLDAESSGDAHWKQHATGTLRVGKAIEEHASSLSDVRARFSDEVPASAYYQRLEAEGHDYGPTFRGVTRIWPSSDEVLAEIELPDPARKNLEKYFVHPALLDAALQLLGATVQSGAPEQQDKTYLPVSLDRFMVQKPGLTRFWSYTRVRSDVAGDAAHVVDVLIYDDSGAVVAEVAGMRLQPITRAALGASARERDNWLHEIEWRVKPNEQAAAKNVSASHWMIVADDQGVGASIADRLRARGDVVAIISSSSSTDFGQLCRDAMAAHGIPRGVIHLSSLDTDGRSRMSSSELERAQQAGCKSLLQVVQGLVATLESDLPRLWVVTRGARQITGSDPDVAFAQAPILGLAATVSAEHPGFKCTQIDLDSQASIDADMLWREIEASDGEDRIAIRSGSRYVARLVRQSQASSSEPVRASASESSEVLDIPSPGVLDHLAWKPASRRAPGPGEIEIQVVATGLNFRDVLTALGMYEGAAGPLGTECAGRVVRIGEGVGEFQVGDEVIAFAGDTFRTFVTLPVDVVTRKPSRLGLVEAATIPATFLTAHHALHHLAHMSAGDRVLVHAAAGGVGLAAVQLAQRAGAEIFATAGSDEKREYLRSLGVRHVMNSRTLEFADEVLKLTGGKGVDIVLNSLAGDFIPRNLAALGANGRFLEIGKKGIWTREQMASARRDVAYHAIYLGELQPAQIRAMFEELSPAFETGALTPLRHRVFERNRAVDAFRHMAQARHIGKIVITHPSAMRGAERPDGSTIRDDATYLVTGGFGALGSQIARWLVAAGARQVALMGRHTETTAAQALIGDLEAGGARVLAVQGDVAREDDVARALQTIRSTSGQLRGVIHAAGVVDDGTLAQQDWPRFEKVIAPKMLGAWHLHAQSQGDPLDFFVLFSSMVSILGSPGQGNYAAANSFLDALAHHRRAQGLPGVSINWGPWAGSGMAGDVDSRHQRRWAAQGVEFMSSEDGLAVLHRLLCAQAAQVAVLPVRWNALLGALPHDAIPPLLSDLERGVSVGDTVTKHAVRRDLRAEIERTAPANRRSALLAEIRTQAAKVLSLDRGHTIDVRQPLNELGLDSLMAVELRNSIGELVGRTLPATLLFKYPTIGALTDYILGEVLRLAEEEAETVPADVDADLADIEPLADDDVKRLLYEELKALGSES